MRTLIIPCAGKSSRFPGMRPKWMLTHPDGRLMVDKALDGIDRDSFDRIIITIVRAHDQKYEAALVLNQVFGGNKKIEICLLDDFTSSASETVYKTLTQMSVEGAFVVKDSDNRIVVDLPRCPKNFIVGYDINVHRDVTNIPGKSFIISNSQKVIMDIVEKKVVSNIICLGIYGFESAKLFIDTYLKMENSFEKNEIYISHVISKILSSGEKVFTQIDADDYEDWGTLTEWRKTQKSCNTYFIDIDGVLMKNCGRYGSFNWDNNDVVLEENAAVIKKLQDAGAMIIITTSRPEAYRNSLSKILASRGINPYAIIMGINHATRVLINDFAPTNPYPSAQAINMPRNANLADYLTQ